MHLRACDNRRMKIEPIPIKKLFEHPQFDEVVADYCNESGNPDLGSAMPTLEWYQRMEDAGLFQCCAAFDADRLVGIVTVVVTLYPHFGKLVGSVESIWLHKDYRKGVAGLRLINEAKRVAKDMGAVGVYFGARDGSRLARLYERIFTPMNRLYWTKL